MLAILLQSWWWRAVNGRRAMLSLIDCDICLIMNAIRHSILYTVYLRSPFFNQATPHTRFPRLVENDRDARVRHSDPLDSSWKLEIQAADPRGLEPRMVYRMLG
jgi:hypothetical protein